MNKRKRIQEFDPEIKYPKNPPIPWKYLECEFCSDFVQLAFGRYTDKIYDHQTKNNAQIIITIGEFSPLKEPINRFYVKTSRYCEPDSISLHRFNTNEEAIKFMESIMKRTSRKWDNHVWSKPSNDEYK